MKSTFTSFNKKILPQIQLQKSSKKNNNVKPMAERVDQVFIQATQVEQSKMNVMISTSNKSKRYMATSLVVKNRRNNKPLRYRNNKPLRYRYRSIKFNV